MRSQVKTMKSFAASDFKTQIGEMFMAAAKEPVQITKRVMAESPAWPAAEVWARQRVLLEQIIASSDAREGALAFAEKRAPRWSGN